MLKNIYRKVHHFFRDFFTNNKYKFYGENIYEHLKMILRYSYFNIFLRGYLKKIITVQ